VDVSLLNPHHFRHSTQALIITEISADSCVEAGKIDPLHIRVMYDVAIEPA
jgi:hypothetical protein